MIGTVCYIADLATENYINEFKIEASEVFHVGVSGGNVPRHISLGMPYQVEDWKSYVSFVEDFAKTLSPVEVTIESMSTTCFPRPDTGAFLVCFTECFGLDEIRARLTREIKDKLGIEIKDNLIGKRNIALGCGSAPIEPYQQYVASVDPSRYMGKTLRFDKIGIFYYPSENWDPATYTCYRRIELNRNFNKR